MPGRKCLRFGRARPICPWPRNALGGPTFARGGRRGEPPAGVRANAYGPGRPGIPPVHSLTSPRFLPSSSSEPLTPTGYSLYSYHIREAGTSDGGPLALALGEVRRPAMEFGIAPHRLAPLSALSLSIFSELPS